MYNTPCFPRCLSLDTTMCLMHTTLVNELSLATHSHGQQDCLTVKLIFTGIRLSPIPIILKGKGVRP